LPPTTDEIAESLARIERLVAKTSETVGILDERLKATRTDMAELKDHQKEANGRMAEVVMQQHQQDGALAVLKWMVTVTLAGIGAGAALAGIVLAVVSRS